MQHKLSYVLLFISLVTGDNENDQKWNLQTKGPVSFTSTESPTYSATPASSQTPKNGKYMVCFVNDQKPQSTDGQYGQYSGTPNNGESSHKPFSPSQPITRVKHLYPEQYPKPTSSPEDDLSFVPPFKKPQSGKESTYSKGTYSSHYSSFDPATSNPLEVMSFVPPLKNKPYASPLVGEKPSYTTDGPYPNKPTPNPEDILASITDAIKQKPYSSTVPKSKPSYNQEQMYHFTKTHPNDYSPLTTEDPLVYQYNPMFTSPDAMLQDMHYAPYRYPVRSFPPLTERPKHHSPDYRHGAHYNADRPYYKGHPHTSLDTSEGKRSMFRSFPRSKMPSLKSKSVMKKVRVLEKSVPYPEELKYQGQKTPSKEESTDEDTQLKAFSYYNFHP